MNRLLSRLLGRPPAAELREAGKRALAAGEVTEALRLLQAAVRRAPKDGEAWLFLGLAHHGLGEYREALERIGRCLALVPSSAEAHYRAAAAHHLLGDGAAAQRHCEAALAREPAHVGTHELLAAMSLPGPHYTRLLSALHRALAPRTYLEIGVATGTSLGLVLPSTRAVGIDPEPRLPAPPAPNVRLYAMTSDDYFATRDPRADLDGVPVDLAFIDGAHLFDQALRDFINVERYVTPRSTVLLHDTYPLDGFTSLRSRQSPFWSGDVWRLVLILKKYRPGLVIANVAAAPTGLCVIRNLDPASSVLADGFDAIVEEFMAVDYGVLEADKPGMLNLVPNHLERVVALVTSGPRAATPV